MKNQLQKIGLLIAAIIGLTASQKAFASHVKSAEITYVQIAPFSYNVTLTVYRDCENALSPLAPTGISVRSVGCNNGRVVALTHTGTAPVGDQTCAQAAGCPTFKEVFTATVTFSITERTCRDWIFSYSECCRTTIGNLVNSQSANLYTESYVRIGQSLQNSSPVIGPLEDPLARFEFSSEAIYSLGTNDPDCDSLSYELVEPLTGPNTPVGYRPNPQTISHGALLMNPCGKPPYSPTPFAGQYAVAPTTFPVKLSPTYPMPSVLVNWSSRPTIKYPGAPFNDSVWEATNAFLLDPVSGTLRFTPAYFTPSAPVGLTSYAIDVLISEWRTLNGIATRVGYTRRSMIFTVVQNNIQSPKLTSLNLNGHPVQPGQVFTIRPGMIMNLQVGTGNCGANDPLTLSSNAAAVLPGAIFSSTTGPNATGSLTWSGNLSCDRPVFFQVKVENNACPFKGFQTHTFGVRVSATARVTGQKEPIASNAGFMAFPNPFTSQVTFSFKTVTSKPQQILIYNGVGQLVDQLELKAAQQEVSWEKAASHGNGLYIARLVQNGQPVQTIRFTKAN